MSNYGKKYVLNKAYLYCYDFAFYQLNEEKAFPYIFNLQVVKWPAEFFNDSINYLASWGYEEVKGTISRRFSYLSVIMIQPNTGEFRNS